tara:strand:+ start:661 stop:837 length:177 start_codon:yes stop_codon:yes gene_type:complete
MSGNIMMGKARSFQDLTVFMLVIFSRSPKPLQISKYYSKRRHDANTIRELKTNMTDLR